MTRSEDAALQSLEVLARWLAARNVRRTAAWLALATVAEAGDDESVCHEVNRIIDSAYDFVQDEIDLAKFADRGDEIK